VIVTAGSAAAAQKWQHAPPAPPKWRTENGVKDSAVSAI
jgi:hypothetical protein